MEKIQKMKEHLKEHEAVYVANVAVAAVIGTSASIGYSLGKASGFKDGTKTALDLFEFCGSYSNLPLEFIEMVRKR